MNLNWRAGARLARTKFSAGKVIGSDIPKHYDPETDEFNEPPHEDNFPLDAPEVVIDEEPEQMCPFPLDAKDDALRLGDDTDAADGAHR
jgi:hypothetical protein